MQLLWSFDSLPGMSKAKRFVQLMSFCALFIFVNQKLRSEEVINSRVNGLAKHWQILKDLSLAIARAIPDDAYSPKVPFAGSDPSVSGPYEMGSLALMSVLSCAMATGTPAPERFKAAFDQPMDSTKTGVSKSLTVAYDYCIDGLKQMTDADLLMMATRGFTGHPASRFDIY